MMDCSGERFSFPAPLRQSTWSGQRFSNAVELLGDQSHFDRNNHLAALKTNYVRASLSTQASPLTPESSLQEKDCNVEVSLEDTAERARNRFLEVITDDPNAIEDESFMWYCKFLETRLKLIKGSHLSACMSETWLRQFEEIRRRDTQSKETRSKENHAQESQPIDLRIVYCLLSTVAGMVILDRHISLSSIVNNLITKSIFASNNEKSKMNQLAFMILGWLSLLYCPSISPLPGKLQIEDERRDTRAHPSKPRAVDQNFNQAYQPIQHLLREFGDIAPSLSTLQCDPSRRDRNREQLIHSYLNYHTLSRICGVKVEWVSNLNSHLEFVQSKRVLKVFRLPSFCYLLYKSKHDEPLLSHLYIGASSASGEKSNQNPNVKDYLREVLLSYRLVFAQDRGSRSAFNSRFKNLSQPPNKTKETADYDPLLPRICGRKWKTESDPYYKSLDADESPPTIYSPDQDFPCLGDKLLKLQRFSADQHPHNLKKLYWDRRDIRQFYTFWAVLWIGGSTILLGVVQLVVAWLQLAAANEQNRLQAAQLAAMQPGSVDN